MTKGVGFAKVTEYERSYYSRKRNSCPSNNKINRLDRNFQTDVKKEDIIPRINAGKYKLLQILICCYIRVRDIKHKMHNTPLITFLFVSKTMCDS